MNPPCNISYKSFSKNILQYFLELCSELGSEHGFLRARLCATLHWQTLGM
jgi:hypothetical protein